MNIVERFEVCLALRKLQECVTLFWHQVKKELKVRVDVLVIVLPLKLLFVSFVTESTFGLFKLLRKSFVATPIVVDVVVEKFELGLLDLLGLNRR